MRRRRQGNPDSGKPEGPPTDTLVVVGEADAAWAALSTFRFVPPRRVEHVARPAWPDPSQEERPLLYLLGRSAALPDTPAIARWLDRLALANSPPVALVLPRTESGWCGLASHPQCCGLLDAQPALDATEVERVITAARRFQVRRWRRGCSPTGRLAWSFSTADAADGERIWLLLSSVLADLRGLDEDLPRLGMAFTEALTNAIEHGNLELASSLKDDDDCMIRFYAERERRLADPRYAAPPRAGGRCSCAPSACRSGCGIRDPASARQTGPTLASISRTRCIPTAWVCA